MAFACLQGIPRTVEGLTGAMNAPKPVLSLLLFGGSLLVSGCASTKVDATQQDPPVWAVDADELTFSCEQPMQVGDFLEWAQQVTGNVYTYDRRVADDVEISWVGTMKCKKGEVGDFVQTMLYVKGLAVQQRSQGGIQVLEVVPIEPR